MALLDQAEIDERLRSVEGWEKGQGAEIQRGFTFEDFAAAIRFINRVAEVAEAANHHPDILLHGWNKVRLTLSTHSQGGLTGADFDLARQIDQLA
jgi:4a-hydroxytetrahydrobiopterin dehydratase